VLIRHFFEADLKVANENLSFYLLYFNHFMTLFPCLLGNMGMSINCLAPCCSVLKICISYSLRLLRTFLRSLIAFCTPSSSSSFNIRLRDVFDFDLMIAFNPFVLMRRSFLRSVVNARRSFSMSWQFTYKVVKAVPFVLSVSIASSRLISSKHC
jgi:hypothetical protein